MKNIRVAILAVCVGTLCSTAALAQSWTNCSGNSSNNDCLGYSVLSPSSGTSNSAFGNYSIADNTTGGDNSTLGAFTLEYNTEGDLNTAVGYGALQYNTLGGYNTAVGYDAGYNNPADASYNIDIGNNGTSSDSGGVIRIGQPGNETSFYAVGIYTQNVSGAAVYVNSSGQLGIATSSIRYKKDVQNMGDASSAIFRLRPVTYRYKEPFADGSDPIEYGLIAEQVAKVYPNLVVRNGNGQIQTVQYEKLTPMLLNELQKQHRLLEQMQKTLAQQQQTLAQQQAAIHLLKTQQTATVQALQKRLTSLEASSHPSMQLEARLGAK